MELGLGLLIRCFCQFRSKDRITRFDVDFVTLQTIYMHKKAIRHKKTNITLQQCTREYMEVLTVVVGDDIGNINLAI